MISSDGRSWPPNRYARKWHSLWHRIRQSSIRDVEIVDGANCYKFRCESLWEYTRCMSLFVKEAATCEWIKTSLARGEVFYDVGANIGIYTVLAAHRTGREGKVYAFEPHSANFTRLLENISVNDLQDIVVPCNFALHSAEGLFDFNYFSMEAASANSQLSSLRRGSESEYQAVISELKYGVPIDRLIETAKFAAPHHIKIDVDGNEMLIIKGMSELLASKQRPKSIQVEINKRYKDDLIPFLEKHGYELSSKGYTYSGLKLIASGGDPEDYAYNAVFRPAS